MLNGIVSIYTTIMFLFFLFIFTAIFDLWSVAIPITLIVVGAAMFDGAKKG